MSEATTEYKADRTGWPSGAWDGEPDKLLWKHKGFDCMVVRNGLGALCGYVGVQEGHPWFGQDYDNVKADAHGGLTYSDFCQGHICHPGPEKTYWLGFDCAHSGDQVPGVMKYDGFSRRDDQYRDLAYVKQEVNRLAEQAAEAAFPRLMNFKEE